MERTKKHKGKYYYQKKNKNNQHSKGGKGKKSQKLVFTHFFAIPLWDSIQAKFRDRQDKFEDFVRTRFPEFIKTYKF